MKQFLRDAVEFELAGAKFVGGKKALSVPQMAVNFAFLRWV